ncbi:MAG: protein BatD, partial [Muribaculaceae bacterium]|nr:protein BatD [Muribaculaceae bacterium]
NNPFSQSADHKIRPDELMVRINMSKTHVYEQEAVVCSIKLYTLFPIDQGSRCTQEPSFDGFLIEDITDNSDVAVENYNGRNYYTLELRRFILYPQQAGTLTIKSGEYDINAVQRDTYIAGNHAFAAPHTTQIHITSNKASVTISPLPSPAPQGFNGAVGRYTITTSIEPTTLRTNASATIKAVVNGNGNIKYLKAPEFKFPDSFDTYEPQTETNVNSNGHDMEGEVTFSYPFTPTTIGDYTLPPLEFVYFDLDSAKYVTIKAPQQKLHVEKGNDAAVNKTESDKPADILPIIDDTSLEREHSFCVSKLPYWLWFIVPALLLVVAAIAWRRRLKQLADVKLMRTKRASKIAQKRLKQAKKYLNNNDKNAFYAEVLTASWGYLSDKLHIPVADLNKDNIDNELEQYGVDNDTRESMLDLLNKCEFAQYAPELSSDNLNDVYAQAATIIDKIESVKPNKKQQ